MTIRIVWVAAALAFLSAGQKEAIGQPDAAIATFPSSAWDTRTPAEVGLKAGKLAAMSSTIDGSGLIIKDGYQVYAWGPQNVKYDWLSAAKAVTSTLLLFAVEEGKLASENALIGPLVEQEFGQSLASKDSLMTFAQLANMTSGYALPGDPAPGSRWGYNDYAVKLFSELLSDAVFGSPLNTVATSSSRLGPLQFQDGSIYSTRQGHGLYTTPRDFARIGWFWLNRGYWNGSQLLDEQAFDVLDSIGADSNLPRTEGGVDDYLNIGSFGGGTNQTGAGPGHYGFNFWKNSNGTLWPDAPTDTYQANGGWNRYVLTVIPSLKIVAAWANGPSDDPDDFAAPMNTLLKLLTEAATIPLSIQAGWSQVSIPVKTSDMSTTGLFQGKVSSAFRFEHGQYVPVDTLEVGVGYLVHSDGIGLSLLGEHVLPQRVPVFEGWNLVGTFHNPVSSEEIYSEPPGIIDSQVFDHIGKNNAVSTLAPGNAYWVRATQDGYLLYRNDPDPSSAAEQAQHSIK